MANIRLWLEEAEARYGEPIEAAVIGRHDNAKYDQPVAADENVVLGRDAALRKLDAEFDNGYGSPDCFPVYAWTASRVFFVHEYDGATDLVWAPRNPMALAPAFGGNSSYMDDFASPAPQREPA